MKSVWLLLGLCVSGLSHAQSPSLQSDLVQFNPSTSPQFQTLSISAVGDVLLHSPLHRQALQHPLRHRSLWPEVEPFLQSSDIAYANLEGPAAQGVAPGGKVVKDPGLVFDKYVYNSYPMFNYHDFLIQDLLDSGIDVVSTANNHALDRGALGVDRTIEALESAKLPFTGTRKSDTSLGVDQTPWQTIVQKNGFTTAWIACSFSTNGVPDPKHQVLHCFQNKATLLKLVSVLSQHAGVDAVIVTPHWGVEYVDRPDQSIKSLAHDIIDAGALVVLGAHPHVPQPWEKYTAKDGRETLIVYSLGNFVSNQFGRLKTQTSILAQVQLIKNPGEKAQIQSAQVLPLIMTRKNNQYQVVPMLNSTDYPAAYQHVSNMFGNP